MEVYVDNARTTPMAPEALEAMMPYLKDKYGSPASIHRKAMEAALALEEAQKTMADIIGAREYEEIVFTSGGTEANNLAIMGAARANVKTGRHILTTAIEHPSVLKVTDYLKRSGWNVDLVGVNPYGLLDPKAVAEKVRDDTVLVSMIMVSDVMGAIEPISEAVKVVREREEDIGHKVIIHVDAVQAFTKFPIDVKALDIDLMSISSHTIHGPKGVGALYVRKGTKIEAIMHGGMVVNSLRPAIEDIAGIVGFSTAASLGHERMERDRGHVSALQSALYRGITEGIEEVQLNGPEVGGGKRSPYNLNITFNYVEGEAIALMLDSKGIYVATGSACASQVLKPNYVILALGKRAEDAHGSIRFSLSRYNTMEEMEYILGTLPGVINDLRKLSPVWSGRSNPKLKG